MFPSVREESGARVIPDPSRGVGVGLHLPTPLFSDRFGPWGLTSILFVLLIVEQRALPHSTELVATTVVTVTLSTLLHVVGPGAPGETLRQAHR